MDDHLAYIKAAYADQGLACLMSEDQILWLVEEVDRLREYIADLEDTPASNAIAGFYDAAPAHMAVTCRNCLKLTGAGDA